MTGTRAKRVKAASPLWVGFLAPSVRLTGELVDFSETGVLVRCSKGVALDTMGRLGIAVGDEMFRSVAVARRHVPGVGVAFKINHMTPRNRDLLRRLLYLNQQKLSA